MRLEGRIVLAALVTAATAFPAWAQAPAPIRFRLVLNASFWPTQTSFSDSRTFTEYAEPTTIHTSYEAGSALGPDVALQVGLFRGLGLLVGYSYASRDVSGQVEVSRPHPLYLNRNRSASAGFSGYGLTEGALHLDLAYARAAGHLDWALFAGATLFQVEAELLGKPTYDEAYPYDELSITATPSTTVTDTRPASTWAADWTTASAARGGSAPASRSSTARRASS